MRTGSRLILAAGMLLAVSRVASAQQDLFSMPPVLPPAPVALPPAPQSLPPLPGPVDLYLRPDNFHQIDPPHQLPVFVPGLAGYVPVYGYEEKGVGCLFPCAERKRHPTPFRTAPDAGGIRFETQPGSAQVYVDGYYAGIVDDFGPSGRMLSLPVGSHRIELQAAGYVTLLFQVSIAPNQIVRYRGDLQRPVAPPSTAPATAPQARTSIYVIPKCYAGNRPPATALPRGCDPRRMRVQESRR